MPTARPATLVILALAVLNSCTSTLWESLAESTAPYDASFELQPRIQRAEWATDAGETVIVLSLDRAQLGSLPEPWRSGRLLLTRDEPTALFPLAPDREIDLALHSRWRDDSTELETVAALRDTRGHSETWQARPFDGDAASSLEGDLPLAEVHWSHTRTIVPSRAMQITLRVLATPATVVVDVTAVGVVVGFYVAVAVAKCGCCCWKN